MHYYIGWSSSIQNGILIVVEISCLEKSFGARSSEMKSCCKNLEQEVCKECPQQSTGELQ